MGRTFSIRIGSQASGTATGIVQLGQPKHSGSRPNLWRSLSGGLRTNTGLALGRVSVSMSDSASLGPLREVWRTVIGQEDGAVLASYARPREPYAGSSPILLVVDVTEAFVGPDLPVLEAQREWRQACGERAWSAVPAMMRLVESFRSAKLPVVFTTPDRAPRRKGRVTGKVRTDDTAGLEVISALQPRAEEWVLRKPRASAFFKTPLADHLVETGCDTVVVGGTTSGCVRATAVDASSQGFEVLVAEGACFDRVSLSHLVSLADLNAKYARVLPTTGILDLLALS